LHFITVINVINALVGEKLVKPQYLDVKSQIFR